MTSSQVQDGGWPLANMQIVMWAYISDNDPKTD